MVRFMSNTRNSETLIWVCIVCCGLAASLAQLSHADRRPDPDGSGGARFARLAALPAPRAQLPAGSETLPPPQDPALMFVEAIVQVESAGNPQCVGKAGERGLMQIKEATWRETTARLFPEPIDFDRAFEPDLNRLVGQAYLAWLEQYLRDHHAHWTGDMRSLLAASYNAGPTRIRMADFDFRRLPPRTQDYARRVTALHDFYLEEPLVSQPVAATPGLAFARARGSIADRGYDVLPPAIWASASNQQAVASLVQPLASAR